MDALWKLTWALPMVLLTGLALMVLLKRVAASGAPGHSSQRLHSRESLQLSEQTRLHLIEVDGKPYVLIESSQQAQLQSLTSHPAPTRNVAGPAWLRQFSNGWQR